MFEAALWALFSVELVMDVAARCHCYWYLRVCLALECNIVAVHHDAALMTCALVAFVLRLLAHCCVTVVTTVCDWSVAFAVCDCKCGLLELAVCMALQV